jgi:hypothetical protein
MELCSGGDLFHRINAKGRYIEGRGKVLLRNIFSAVAYIHSQVYFTTFTSLTHPRV